MTTTDTPPPIQPDTSPHARPDLPGSEAPRGGGGQPSEIQQDGISESAHGIFGQSAFTESALAKAWGVPREDLRAFRLEQLTEGADWAMESRQVTYSAEGKKKAAAAFGVPVEADAPAPQPSDAPAATPGAFATPFCVHRLVTNPKLVLFREKNAVGEKTGPDLRLRVRDSSRFIPGMDLTGRVRLIPGHTDFYELTCPQPRYRGRW